ncbi:uncharacterized protein G2W53_024120 [Senna tora]|uniref:Uncharacterized protein n=1 Tax=Senna tora TaxID=362788 RepID=A0A834TCR8_9FABA|nr:uncharacterized protein G2W53_024120 [Senna tora]
MGICDPKWCGEKWGHRFVTSRGGPLLTSTAVI